jgi:HAD superfamily hydrolase (TIGR01509 family)
MFLSFEIGSLKPEPEIYKAVEDFTKLHPQEHIFIDDIKEYTDAAKLRGWYGIQFLKYNQLVNELRKRNILF